VRRCNMRFAASSGESLVFRGAFGSVDSPLAVILATRMQAWSWSHEVVEEIVAGEIDDRRLAGGSRTGRSPRPR
jgi:hypothetical protein